MAESIDMPFWTVQTAAVTWPKKNWTKAKERWTEIVKSIRLR